MSIQAVVPRVQEALLLAAKVVVVAVLVPAAVAAGPFPSSSSACWRFSSCSTPRPSLLARTAAMIAIIATSTCKSSALSAIVQLQFLGRVGFLVSQSATYCVVKTDAC